MHLWWTSYIDLPIRVGLSDILDEGGFEVVLSVLLSVLFLWLYILMSAFWIWLWLMLSTLPLLVGIATAAGETNVNAFDSMRARTCTAFAAGQMALLAMLAYTGLGREGGLRYDCGSTWAWEGYNWLG